MNLSDQEKDALRAEFDKLNQAVVSATLERAVFLKENLQNMGYYNKGEDIYDLSTCTKLGTVTETYIYGFSTNYLEDNSLSLNFNYHYKLPYSDNVIDNTSRRYVHHGNREDLKHSLDLKRRIAEMQLKQMEEHEAK